MSFPRYDHYKDSGVEWLGEVPVEWDFVPLKRLVSIQNGSDHKHIEQEEGVPVIGSGGVFAYASDFIYDGESVLLGRKGTIDKPLYVLGKFWTVDTMYWTKIKPGVCGRFVYYAALTIPFNYYSTNTALPSMTKGALDAHVITRPPLPEQHAIAAFLDRETAKIDALIAEQQRLVALLAEKRQAVISHAVTKGLNPDAPMKDSGIEWLGEVPVGWEVKPISFVSKYLSYGFTNPMTTTDEGPYMLTANDIGDGVLKYETARRTSHDQFLNDLSDKSRPKKDDILITKDGTLGRVALHDGQVACINQSVALLRVNAEIVSAKFLSTCLRGGIYQDRMIYEAGGTTIKHIYISRLAKMPVAIPPKEEQAEINVFLDTETDKLDALTTEAQRAIALLQERRTALISAAVTGKIDVRGLAAA